VEWSEKIRLVKGPTETCVVCERPGAMYYLPEVADSPPVHMVCAAKVLIASEVIRRGQPLTETHKRWLTRNRLRDRSSEQRLLP
jgi:hypothetical protein